MTLIQISDIKKVVKQSFPKATIRSILPLSKALNINYKISFKGSIKPCVLRIYPNQPWKAHKENALYNLLRTKSTVPVPRVFFADPSLTIIPLPYLLLEYIEGESLSQSYVLSKNTNLIYEAGKILGIIHSITFPTYGWITAGSIENSHTQWNEFLKEDFSLKLQHLHTHPQTNPLLNKLQKQFTIYLKTVPKKGKPVLLHKDYHGSHIITDKHHVKGIIDLEWAIAGRPGLDFVKANWWLFEECPALKHPFYAGYTYIQKKELPLAQEMHLYDIYTAAGLVAFSIEQKITKWFKPNLMRLRHLLETNL